MFLKMSLSVSSPQTLAENKDEGSLPSSVPKSGRRRESIGAQMRHLAAGLPGTISFNRSNGQTIPPLLTSASSRANLGPRNTSAALNINSTDTVKSGTANMSTSFGTAAEALSGHKTVPFVSRSFTTSTGGLVGKPNERSTGHSHFGQECFGPQPGDPTTIANPPAHALLTKENVQKNNRSGDATRQRRNSFSSVATDDDKSLISNSQALHKCEACSKVYRHPSCLVKHRWEHTVYWKEASKFLMSKHQQVQLLEAAAILVGMDTHARSLPEEKALWPAAVSPPSSGLLGSDKINFEKLLAQKTSRKSQSPTLDRKDATKTKEGIISPATMGTSLPGAAASSLSPINTFTTLNLGKFTRTGDIGPLRLDESAERNVREESVETEDDEDDEDDEEDHEGEDESMTGSTSISTGSPSREADERERERYGVGAGGDVLAEMEMDMEMEAVE